MRRHLLMPIVFVLLNLFSTVNNAALIQVNDGQSFDFDPVNNEYQFLDSLTAADPTVTYGFELDMSDNSTVSVTAPAGLDLWTMFSTGPDFGGTAILKPNSVSKVYSGTSSDFLIDGTKFITDTHWLTIGVPGDFIGVLEDSYGGELPISQVADFPFIQLPGNSNGNGNPTLVPEPSLLLLLGSGLLALGFTSKKRAP